MVLFRFKLNECVLEWMSWRILKWTKNEIVKFFVSNIISISIQKNKSTTNSLHIHLHLCNPRSSSSVVEKFCATEILYFFILFVVHVTSISFAVFIQVFFFFEYKFHWKFLQNFLMNKNHKKMKKNFFFIIVVFFYSVVFGWKNL